MIYGLGHTIAIIKRDWKKSRTQKEQNHAKAKDIHAEPLKIG